ncbi:MAG: ABC transporter permease [Geodermatophilaceae bacterium]|nr:ABC transporter permease [Geodermatophilaceae bacterium]
MSQAPEVGWLFGVVLITLVGIAVLAARFGGLPLGRDLVTAALRAAVQLAVVALFIAAVLSQSWASALFALLMFAVATGTAARRVGATRSWPWVAAALGGGVAPVLVLVFGSGVVPLNGAGIVPIAGIIIGGTMTALSLTGRRAFSALRQDRGLVEAGLALGMQQHPAVLEVIARHSPEAMTPVLDQTRTVGLVTLPGAFVGVLLGGGSAIEAGTAQLLVLVGLLAAQTVTVVLTQQLIAADRIMPPDIRANLPP